MQLRHHRLNEVVATDTSFSSIRLIKGYCWCAQMFYGCTSRHLDVFGVKDSDEEFPEAFICHRGIPSALHCDNAKAQQSERIKRIHHNLVIADRHTEPHSPCRCTEHLARAFKAKTKQSATKYKFGILHKA